MKKFLLILALGAFAACNDDGTSDSTSNDSSVVVPNAVDSNTVTPMDTSHMGMDSMTHKPDTTIRK